jgi:hypothetical protein
LDSLHLLDLHRQASGLLGVDDVVLVVVDVNVELAGLLDLHLTWVNVNQVALLVSGQDDLVVGREVLLVVDDLLDVTGSLEIVLTSEIVDADVADLGVPNVEVVVLPNEVVVEVVVFDVGVWLVLVCLGDLEDDVCLLLLALVVGVYQHVLVVVGHVEVLVHDLGLAILLLVLELDFLLLDGELSVLVLQEWELLLMQRLLAQLLPVSVAVLDFLLEVSQ